MFDLEIVNFNSSNAFNPGQPDICLLRAGDNAENGYINEESDCLQTVGPQPINFIGADDLQVQMRSDGVHHEVDSTVLNAMARCLASHGQPARPFIASTRIRKKTCLSDGGGTQVNCLSQDPAMILRHTNDSFSAHSVLNTLNKAMGPSVGLGASDSQAKFNVLSSLSAQGNP